MVIDTKIPIIDPWTLGSKGRTITLAAIMGMSNATGSSGIVFLLLIGLGVAYYLKKNKNKKEKENVWKESV